MPFHQHGTLLKHYGFKQLQKAKSPSPYNPAKMLLSYSEWEHTKLGLIAINHFEHSFCFYGYGKESVLNVPTGKNNANLEVFLKKEFIASAQPIEMEFPTGLPDSMLQKKEGKQQITNVSTSNKVVASGTAQLTPESVAALTKMILKKKEGEQQKVSIIPPLLGSGLDLGNVKFIPPLPPKEGTPVGSSWKLGSNAELTQEMEDWLHNIKAEAALKEELITTGQYQEIVEPVCKKKYGLEAKYVHKVYSHILYSYSEAEDTYISSQQGKKFSASTIKWMLSKDILAPVAPVLVEAKPEFVSTAVGHGFLPASEHAGVLHKFKEEQVQDYSESFDLLCSASGLGGAHAKYFVVEKATQKKYLFKPALTIGGKKSSVLAYADYLAAKVLEILRPEAHIPVFVGSMQIADKKVFGSFQLFLSDAIPMSGPLTEELKVQLQREHVIDWLISNHDAHSKHFITMGGVLFGVDKTQSYKFFPDDQLSTIYHPNQQEAAPYYNQFFNEHTNSVDEWTGDKGTFKLNPSAIYDIVTKAQAIPDADFKIILLRYAVARYKKLADVELFLHAACQRKNNLKKDLEKFYGTEIKAPPKPKPEEKSKGNPELIAVLQEKGYSFYNFGAKSKCPKYKDKEGKTVYLIEPDSWEYYPMGSASMNPYGSTYGKGKLKLVEALEQPFEKPEAPEPVITPTVTQWAGKDAEKFKALPEHVFKLPEGYTTSGNPVSHTELATEFTDPERSTIQGYKGSGFHSINKFLYSGQEAHGGNYLAVSVSNLNTAMAKSKTNKPLVLWRGLQGSYSDLIRKLLLDGGKLIQPNCFQSCSTSQTFAHNWAGTTAHSPKVVLCLTVPKGTPAIAPSAVTDIYKSEKELILSHTVVYKVQGLYKYNGALYAEVTAEDTSVVPKQEAIEVLVQGEPQIWVEPTVTKTGVHKSGYFKTKKKKVS